ncbi:hypothetical protein EZV62_019936 [Acer yangbiense]|uniref:BHLH domain-containing protein n=1 Tax=Acer yangbiense TaxID=1000413 RepID=A0A5C7HC72_9ROSI|nr:hypothetical protein EZV62_019936 [Acer yangbiense]
MSNPFAGTADQGSEEVVVVHLSVAEILKEATSYIQQLQRNGELLERKKALLKGDDDIDHKTSNIIGSSSNLPIINFTTLDSILEVNLVSALNKNFMLYEIINVLLEEGAEVVHAAHINAGDKSIYVIKSKDAKRRLSVRESVWKLQEWKKDLKNLFSDTLHYLIALPDQ